MKRVRANGASAPEVAPEVTPEVAHVNQRYRLTAMGRGLVTFDRVIGKNPITHTKSTND